MAITSTITDAFKRDLLKGVHTFATSGGNTFKLALYTSGATLNASTASYITANEASGTNTYTAGGGALTVSASTPTVSSNVGFVDFSDLTFASETITARGCLIYNDTATGNNTVAAIDFGSNKSSSAGNFTIASPTASSGAAIIRIA